MDKSARAAQLAGCIAHTGDAFIFAAGGAAAPITWYANAAAQGAASGGKLNPLIKPGHTQLVGPRAAFTGRLPKPGDDLTDAGGHIYTVREVPSDPTNPLLTLVCTCSLVTPA